MVQFGSDPSEGTLFRASQFIVEELPIRLAHRVKDLESLPNELSDMPSILRVKNWYAQSFEELTSIPPPKLSADVKSMLYKQQKIRANGKTNGAVVSDPSDATTNNGGHNLASKDIAIKPERGSASIDPLPEDFQAEGYQDYGNIPTAMHEGTVANDQGLGKSKKSRFSSFIAAQFANARKYFANVEPNYPWPPEIAQYNAEVTRRLQKIKARHDGVVSTVARGILEWKDSRPDVKADYSIQNFLDRFYMSRIGIRMLIGQHIALNMDRGTQNDYVGIICTRTNVREIALAAADHARFLCEDWYGLFKAPDVDVVCDPNLNFMYVPGHLSHMLFETIKNSLRAVVETHGEDAESYPPIKVIVVEGQEDITIKVSDEGGGIPRSEVPYVWTYMYTTVKHRPELEDEETSRSDFKAPMAGYGYGLPISRLYSRYFGGDLKLISMEGYGTDVYLHLNRLSSSTEPLA